MAENKYDRLPRDMPLEQLVEIFDTQDMGDYWESLPDAHFEVTLERRKRFIAVDEILLSKLAAIARNKAVSTEDLVESYLWEKVREAA